MVYKTQLLWITQNYFQIRVKVQGNLKTTIYKNIKHQRCNNIPKENKDGKGLGKIEKDYKHPTCKMKYKKLNIKITVFNQAKTSK